jgi:hypothetical protein
MTDEQIKHMVNRFLGWRLPDNFGPDGGILFKPFYNVEYNAARGKPPARHQPSGTNLFGADQAETMVRHMIEEMPHGWQPIETAPHTGIAILLWQPWKSGRNCQVIGHYANGWVDRDCEELFVDPTHWMPLPDAPPAKPGAKQ